MPRATRNRTLIAQARVSAPELAKWRAKVAAAGVPLSELLRRAMARTRTWTAAAAKVERERTRELVRIGSHGFRPPLSRSHPGLQSGRLAMSNSRQSRLLP